MNTEASILKPETEIEFDAENHIYRVNGQVKPNVTGIIGAAGLCGSAVEFWGEDAAWFGAVVHRCCQLDDEGDLEESTVPREARGRLEAWRRFRRETGFMPRLNEHRLYNAQHDFCTTIDREGQIPSLIPSDAVVDLKSGAILPAHGVQLAAHVHSLPGLPWARQRVAVRLRNDGSYSIKIFSMGELFDDFYIFLSALNIWNWKKLRGVK